MRFPRALLLASAASLLSLPAGAADDTLTTYRDADLAMTYSYPASFHANAALSAIITNGLAAKATAEKDPTYAKCVTLPIAAMQQGASEKDFGLIVVMRFNHTCIGEPGTADNLATAAGVLPSSVLSRFGNPILERAVNYKLDGYDAAFVQGSVPAKMIGDGVMLHAGSVCALVKQNTVCWLILDSDYKAMPPLVSAPVTFNGHPAVPLLDKDVVPKW